jgi:hypothetical protein
LPPAASRACAIAVASPSVTNVNVVPPPRTSGSRGLLVTTNTGARNGGSSPHGSSPPSNIRLPITYAPAAVNISSMISESTVRSPPVKPCRSRQAIASVAQRVTRKNPAASADSIQLPVPSNRGPA